MKTNYLKFLIIPFMISTISSCEQGYSYSYILTNSTDTMITVYIKTSSRDTTFNFLPGETKAILSTFHGMEGFGGPFLRDVKFDLDSVALKRGERITLKDYRETKSWKFIKENEHTAEYKSIVSDSDF